MPYADPATANNLLADSIESIKARNGNGEWREVLTATKRHRSVLLHWLPGNAQPSHMHPHSEEIFVVHDGQVEIDFGSGRVERAGPGGILYAGAQTPHAVRVAGDRPLLMMCFLSRNEPDSDTIDLPER